MYSVAEQAARRLSIGQLNAADAETWIRSRMRGDGAKYAVSVTPPGGLSPSDDSFTVDVALPMATAAVIDPLGFFADATLSASIAIRQE